MGFKWPLISGQIKPIRAMDRQTPIIEGKSDRNPNP
jgi:hypothetical protein